MAEVTKRDIIDHVASSTNLTRVQIEAILDLFLDHLSKELAAGGRAEFRGFGAFECKISQPRIGRNPRKPGVDIQIPSRRVVKFKAGKVVQEALEAAYRS